MWCSSTRRRNFRPDAEPSAIVDKVVTSIFGGDLETDQTSARAKLSLAAFSQAPGNWLTDKARIAITAQAGFDPTAASPVLRRWGGSRALPQARQGRRLRTISCRRIPSTPGVDTAVSPRAEFERRGR